MNGGPGAGYAWDGSGDDGWDDWAPGEVLTPGEIAALAEADGGNGHDDGYDPACDDDDPRIPPGIAEDAGPAAGEVWDAGFTHGVPGAAGAGFAAGGVLDRMLPGQALARFAGAARAAGLGRLSDDELIGFLCAARRNASWQHALELAAVGELDRRRRGGGGRAGEHVAEEIAAALTLTRRSAEGLLSLATGISRLWQVPAALAAGLLDLGRAAVFARELLCLDDELAVRAEAMVMPRAGELTAGQLAAALQRAVLRVDPRAAERRRSEAERQARVEVYPEPGRGTAALAGRDLPAAEVIAADQRLTAAARWLRAHGAAGGMDFLRAQAYCAFVNGAGLAGLLARLLAAPEAPGGSGPGSQAAPTVGTATTGTTDTGCAAAEAGQAGAGAGSAGRPASAQTPPGPAGRPVPAGLASPATPAGLAALTGSVNLVMPAAAWLGLSNAPGEITGSPAGGPADAATCRDLATALAASPRTRWCLTITGPHGQAIAHGCARKGPGPPGTRGPGPPGMKGSGPPGAGPGTGPGPPDRLGWLRSIPLIPLLPPGGEDCPHGLGEPGYRPSARLRHLVAIRDRRCTAPWCRRPATACDHDHTIPWQPGGHGGPTCLCNLGPACRRDHRTKQAEGWSLQQPWPGSFTWTAPSGRTYTTRPEPYPL